MACHVEPDRPNSCCCIGQECAVPKITCDVSDRKPAPTCQEKKFFGIFLSSRPEHNQKPPTDTANRHCAFIPTRRKIAVWPQGAQSTAPLARGRSKGRTAQPRQPPALKNQESRGLFSSSLRKGPFLSKDPPCTTSLSFFDLFSSYGTSGHRQLTSEPDR